MATAAIAGYKGAFFFSTSTSGAKTRMVEVQDFTLTVEHSEIDATSHDSSGTREVIGGISSWSGSADVLMVLSSGGPGSHNAAFDVLIAKTLVDFEFIPTGSSSDGYYEGQGFFTNFELGSPGEDALATSLSLVGTGSLTRAASSS